MPLNSGRVTRWQRSESNGLDQEHYLRRGIADIAEYPVQRAQEVLPWDVAEVRERLDQRDAA